MTTKRAPHPATRAPRRARASPVSKQHERKVSPLKPTSKRAAPAARSRPRHPAAPPLNAHATNVEAPTEAALLAMPETDYMNAAQLAFFRNRLLDIRRELCERIGDFSAEIRDPELLADPSDRATMEEERWIGSRLRERESTLLWKIDHGLERIRTKEYGYCEKTGDPIGLARLLARPTASVCVAVKGRDERVEAEYRDSR